MTMLRLSTYHWFDHDECRLRAFEANVSLAYHIEAMLSPSPSVRVRVQCQCARGAELNQVHPVRQPQVLLHRVKVT